MAPTAPTETDLPGEANLPAGALFCANMARGAENLTVSRWLVGSEFTLNCGVRCNGMDFVRPEQLDTIVTGLPRVGDVEHDLQTIMGGNLMRIANPSMEGARMTLDLLVMGMLSEPVVCQKLRATNYSCGGPKCKHVGHASLGSH